jgi:DNA-binding response OmpR family regulator
MKAVLAIDDVEGVRKAIEMGLRNSGYDVTTAGTYADGIGLAVSRPFDIILCDLKLPDKSGVDIIKALRENKINTPVIAVSGFIDAATMKNALSAGAVAYLTKPFLKKDLIAILESVVPSGER